MENSSYVKKELLNLQGLTASAKNILISISSYSEFGWYGSAAVMAQNIAKSKRTVQRCVADLKAKDLIFQKYVTVNGQRLLSYFANWKTINYLSATQNKDKLINKKGPCRHSPTFMNFQKGEHYIPLGDSIAKSLNSEHSQTHIEVERPQFTPEQIKKYYQAICPQTDKLSFIEALRYSFFTKTKIYDSDIVTCRGSSDKKLNGAGDKMSYLGGDKMSCHQWQNVTLYNKNIYTRSIYCIGDYFYWVSYDNNDNIEKAKIIGTIRALAKELKITLEQANAVADAVKNKINISLDELLISKEPIVAQPTKIKESNNSITSCDKGQFSSAELNLVNIFTKNHKANAVGTSGDIGGTTKLFNKPVTRSYNKEGEQTSGFVSIYGDKKKITIDDLKMILTRHYRLNTDKVEILAQEIYTHFTSKGRNWRWGKGRVTLNNLAQVIYPWVKRDRNNGKYIKYNRIVAEQPISFKAESFCIDTPSVINLKAEKAELSKNTQLNSNNYFVIDYAKRGISAGDLKEFFL